jgi:hypothetical protein
MPMQITPEQRAEIERQRALTPGRRSFMLDFTPAQREEYLRIAAQEDASADANLDWLRKCRNAEREPGFSGDLRRAINAARRAPRALAGELGIDVDVLQQFRAGDASLPSDVVDRLVAALGLRLMAEIRG